MRLGGLVFGMRLKSTKAYEGTSQEIRFCLGVGCGELGHREAYDSEFRVRALSGFTPRASKARRGEPVYLCPNQAPCFRVYGARGGFGAWNLIGKAGVMPKL